MTVDALTPDDWPAVRAIYEEGIATGLGTFETAAPSWDSSDAPRVAAFRKSIAIVAALPCDVMVSVHPEFTNLLDKIARKAKGDAGAFIDPRGCRRYAADAAQALDRRLASEAAAK